MPDVRELLLEAAVHLRRLPEQTEVSDTALAARLEAAARAAPAGDEAREALLQVRFRRVVDRLASLVGELAPRTRLVEDIAAVVAEGLDLCEPRDVSIAEHVEAAARAMARAYDDSCFEVVDDPQAEGDRMHYRTLAVAALEAVPAASSSLPGAGDTREAVARAARLMRDYAALRDDGSVPTVLAFADHLDSLAASSSPLPDSGERVGLAVEQVILELRTHAQRERGRREVAKRVVRIVRDCLASSPDSGERERSGELMTGTPNGIAREILTALGESSVSSPDGGEREALLAWRWADESLSRDRRWEVCDEAGAEIRRRTPAIYEVRRFVAVDALASSSSPSGGEAGDGDELRAWEVETKLAAETIAYTAWRYRNPAAGGWDPIRERGHREMVEAAGLYLSDPRPWAFRPEFVARVQKLGAAMVVAPTAASGGEGDDTDSIALARRVAEAYESRIGPSSGVGLSVRKLAKALVEVGLVREGDDTPAREVALGSRWRHHTEPGVFVAVGIDRSRMRFDRITLLGPDEVTRAVWSDYLLENFVPARENEGGEA